MELNYQFIGNKEASKLIIFLHEGLGSVAQWKTYPAKLCELTNTYGLVYDRKGYGKSLGNLKDRKATYLHDAAHELFLLITKLKLFQYEIYLYGHSDGGSIALIYAADFKKYNLKGIITEAAHVFVEPKTIEGVKDANIPFKKGKFDGLAKYHGKRFKEVFYAWNDIWLSPLFAHWNIVHKLPQINCPILIIQGEDDQYGTLKQVETIAESVNSELIQTYTPSDCGHAPHKEQQKDTLLTVHKFINEST